jgi:hypothetical protein
MALAPNTGNPPAVTHAQVEAWSKLADDVAAALTMGGQQGFDLLLQVMNEWCEAVDDVNSARRVCVDLAQRGLRHEALDWHAKGFFEVADRLDPVRPGWEAWEAALRERDVIIPHVDGELKEMVDAIFEELQMQDLSGQSLGDWLGRLRRNILLRGHLGERATILESILKLDPGAEAWHSMVAPIRGTRAKAIAEEVKAAIAARHFEEIARLRREVEAQNGQVPLPGNVAAVLAGTGALEAAKERRSQLSQAAASLVGFYEQGRSKPQDSAPALATVEAANNARQQYSAIRGKLVEAIRSACSTPEVAALVEESGMKNMLAQLDAAIREPCDWLEQQAVMAQHRAAIQEIETDVLRTLESLPRKSNDLDVFRGQRAKWEQQTAKVLERARTKAGRLPGGMTTSIDAAMKRVASARRELELHLEHLRRREKMIVVWVLVGVGLVFLLIVGVVVIAMAAS